MSSLCVAGARPHIAFVCWSMVGVWCGRGFLKEEEGVEQVERYEGNALADGHSLAGWEGGCPHRAL